MHPPFADPGGFIPLLLLILSFFMNLIIHMFTNTIGTSCSKLTHWCIIFSISEMCIYDDVQLLIIVCICWRRWEI